jgi:hypothetical protein
MKKVKMKKDLVDVVSASNLSIVILLILSFFEQNSWIRANGRDGG